MSEAQLDTGNTLASDLDRRDEAGKNVASLLHHLQGAYETGDDALIEQAEAALNAVLTDEIIIPIQ
jgi:hypothetical protein